MSGSLKECRIDATLDYQPQDEATMIDLGKQAAEKRNAAFSEAFWHAIDQADGVQSDENKCTCHERDGSYVCDYCFAQGHRGHMQKGS